MPLVEVKNLSKYYKKNGVTTCAVANASFCIYRGETLGVVGESGCGKTTLGKLLLKLEQSDEGVITFSKQAITDFSFKQMRQIRQNMQMIFQASADAFNPYFTVEQIIAEPLINYKHLTRQGRQQLISKTLELVGLDSSFLSRHSDALSGGQKQRIGIARALVLEPEFVVCDEIVSSIDFALKQQILTLINTLKKTLQLTYLFISHDISAINFVSDRIIVMYLGHIVEVIPKMDNRVQHPYSQTLLSTVLPTHPSQRTPFKQQIYTDAPKTLTGCPYYHRCVNRQDICKQQTPSLIEIASDHWVACHQIIN